MSTDENLEEAFAGESRANRMYTAFAEKAESEGLENIARLFRAAADAERVHAAAHLRAMGAVRDTGRNLETAAEGEAVEFRKMYPAFIREAEEEGNTGALYSMRGAMAVEEIHHNLYSEALESARKGKDLPSRKIFVCQVCGNTVYGTPPEKCPICGVPAAKFKEIT